MAWGRSPSLYLLNTKQVFHVRDEKADNTQGGGFTSGAYRTRTLNEVKTNTISGASLASNQITLPAGTYWIEAIAQAWNVDLNKLRLYNTTSSTTLIVGINDQHQPTVNTGGHAMLRGQFTLSATSALELQHRCSTTSSTAGFGLKCNFGDVEVYADVVIWKVN